jgi:hypothetical protein
MRKHLDIAVNIAILATCVVVVHAVLFPRQEARRRVDQTKVLQKGDQLAGEELPLSRADQTLLMVLQSDCRYCTESIPFYNRLSDRLRTQPEKSRVQLIVLTRDALKTAEEYLTSHQLIVDATVTMSAKLRDTLRIPGTPALLLVGRTGLIQDTWFGKLTSDGERQVEAALFAAQ